MKFVLYWSHGKARPGVIVDGMVIDISRVVDHGQTAQQTMENIINSYDTIKSKIEALSDSAPKQPLSCVHLLPPLPRPGKILSCIANYRENNEHRDPRPLNMFMKNPEAVIGPGDTIQLPNFEEPSSFMHEAELALVIKGPVKHVTEENWRSAIFGYTGLIDVTARGEGRSTWKKNSWMGKSFDTFAPIGPCIVTADEIDDPNDIDIKFWNNGELRHDFNTSDMEHKVPEVVSFASQMMTLNSGDLIATGTNHEGLGYLQHNEEIEISLAGIGTMKLNVFDPLNRSWERGVYLGADSTNHAVALKDGKVVNR
ncbi:fumarylacetoacetate hydrolase family protein [Alteromonas sp. NFXS44]|uniref:fumarylacetoacetate hydrolase family protein n=1 Tax=Alteromonas sp. NFXS44 TaxID=2818435 RepID=UPI0032DF9B6E